MIAVPHNKLSLTRMPRAFWGVCLFLLGVRLLAMWLIPLNDSTEARYAEMARKMLVSHDWITLWHAPGIPFWGKPPLTIWLAAAAMKIGGTYAFVARFPAFLLSLGVLACVSWVLQRQLGKVAAYWGAFILASCAIFYLAAGTVMMDPALLFGTVLSQVMAWHVLHEKASKRHGYLFFIGLSIGLLAKGPVVLILVGGPLSVWTVWKWAWRDVWERFPWITGTILLCVLVLPWHILAELKTPGFLQYFIVGEHFGRFFQPAWQGDKYGFAHVHVLGTSWIYAGLASAPWCLLLAGVAFKREVLMRRDAQHYGPWPIALNEWRDYWLCQTLFPVIFFTFARNLIYPYLLPMLPSFAILCVTYLLHRATSDERRWIGSKSLLIVGSVVGIGCLSVIYIFIKHPAWVEKSDVYVIQQWQQQSNKGSNPLVFWKTHLSFSAQFYSHGQSIAVDDKNQLCTEVNINQPIFIVVSPRVDDLPGKVEWMQRIHSEGQWIWLVRLVSPACR